MYIFVLINQYNLKSQSAILNRETTSHPLNCMLILSLITLVHDEMIPGWSRRHPKFVWDSLIVRIDIIDDKSKSIC